MTGRVRKAELFATLPPPWPENLRPQIRAALADAKAQVLFLLADEWRAQAKHQRPN